MTNSYHVVRINENGQAARVTDRGMTAEQAGDEAARMRASRPAGSSIDYRAKLDSKLAR